MFVKYFLTFSFAIAASALCYSQKIELISFEKLFDSNNKLISVYLNLKMDPDTNVKVFISENKYKKFLLTDILELNTIEFDTSGFRNYLIIKLDTGDSINYEENLIIGCGALDNLRKFILKKENTYHIKIPMFSTSNVSEIIKKYNEKNSPDGIGKELEYKINDKLSGKEIFNLKYDLHEIYE